MTNKCINCEEPFSKANVYSAAGWRETQISHMCERCFDHICRDPDEVNAEALRDGADLLRDQRRDEE